MCDQKTSYALPVFKDFAIKSQVQIVGTPRLVSEKLYIGICGINPAESCNCDRENVIENGEFDIDLSGWTADDFIWKDGRAAYQFTTGCYTGTINQECDYNIGYFKVKFAYISDSLFEIVLRIFDGSTMLDEVVIKSIPDSVIHLVETNFSVTTATVNNITFAFKCRSKSDEIGAPYTDVCNNTGDAEKGFYFDKIEVFRTDICEKKLDEDIELKPVCSMYKFVTLYDDEELPVSNPYNLCYSGNFPVILDEKFSANPFDPITSSDLSFELTFPKKTQLQVYIGSKVYVVSWNTLSSTTVEISGNVYFVKVGYSGADTSSGRKTQFLAFLNDTIDANHSTTSSLVSNTFTIANIPAGSFINNAYGFINTISSTTPTTKIGKSFYWDGTKLVYYGSAASYQVTSNLTGLYYNITFDYIANYSDLTGNVIIDDGVSPQSLPITFNSGNGNISVAFTTGATGSNDIKIEIVDSLPHGNGISIDNLKIQETVKFNVTSSTTGDGYATVPVAIYYGQELLDKISELLGIDFNCSFISCCPQPKIEFIVSKDDDDTEFNYSMEQFWDIAQIEFPELLMEGTVAIDECFKYCILDDAKNVIACSNVFKRIFEDCYTTVVEYWNDENAFGFKYPTSLITNLIRLPFYPHGPQFPVTEKFYKESSGIYRRVSTEVEEEYNTEVDKTPIWFHRMLAIALKHDNVLFSSSRIGFFRESISQQGSLDPDWKNTTDAMAKAKFKFKKVLNGTNSNCKSSNSCS